MRVVIVVANGSAPFTGCFILCHFKLLGLACVGIVRLRGMPLKRPHNICLTCDGLSRSQVEAVVRCRIIASANCFGSSACETVSDISFAKSSYDAKTIVLRKNSFVSIATTCMVFSSIFVTSGLVRVSIVAVGGYTAKESI